MFIQYLSNYILWKIIKNIPLNVNLISYWYAYYSAFRAQLNWSTKKDFEDKDLFAQRSVGLTF